jgi:hypothetical protein
MANTEKSREITINSVLEIYAISEVSKLGRCTFNHDSLFRNCRTKGEKYKINKLFIDNIKTVTRDWGYVLVVTHINDEGELYYHFEAGSLENVTSVDVNEFISEAMRDFAYEVADGFENGWMWVVNPSNSYDWNASIESLLEDNIERGMLGDEFKDLPAKIHKYKLLKPLEERETCILN